MFSIFWGIIFTGFLGWTAKEPFVKVLTTNIYSACIVFSLFSIYFGAIIGQINKDRKVFSVLYSKLLNWIKKK
jgi:hypothetical protein